MSTTSPIQPGPSQASTPKPLTPGEGAKIILESAGPAVNDDKSRQTLKGEVTGVKPDGTVQVKTEKGAVEILIPPESKTPRPQPGDKVEIDVKPEDKSGAPREVSIRVTERAPQDARTETRRAETQAPPPRTSETPVEVSLEPPPPPPAEFEAATRPEAAPLVKGDIVRLQPLPPALQGAVIPLPPLAPEEVIAARLSALSQSLAQNLTGKIVALEDIPLRPVLNTQSEIRTDFLTQPAASASALSSVPPSGLLQTVPPPAALLPSLPLAEPASPASLTSPAPTTQNPPVLAFAGHAAEKPALTIAPPSALAPVAPGVPALLTAALPQQGLPASATILSETALPGQTPSPASALDIKALTLQPLFPWPDAAQTSLSLPLQVSGIPPEKPLFAAPSVSLPGENPLTFTPPFPAIPADSPAAGITAPHAGADTLIAKVSGFIKGDAAKGDIPVVKLDSIAPGAPDSPGKPASQPLFILHMPEAGTLPPPGTELALSPFAPETRSAATLTAGTLSSSALPAGTLAAPPAWPAYAIPALTPQLWPTLDQIYQGLETLAPQAALNLANVTARPDNPAQMMPAALFFIAAIRAGDVQGWLGEKTLETLKTAGKSGLLSRLTQEGGVLSKLAGEPLSGDWRGLAFPMAWQNEIHKIALYYKHEENDESGPEDKGVKGTRFIMDMTLTRIGRVQLDGYCRGKSFDLILRSDEPFSAAARQSLRALYHGALEWEGLSGDLGFQNKPEQWVKITGGREIFRSEA